jgi:nitrate reductase molybdenum cofactor assembly chaperone
MRLENPLYVHLAHLLHYPEEGYRRHFERLNSALNGQQGMEGMLEPFRSFVANSAFTELEELFTRTFDMNPPSCLEVGWHLYGEDYKRGELLVNMRQALAQYHLPESEELPDHMSHCLQLLARMEPEEAPIFVDLYLLPALEKILEGLKPENPFTDLLQVLKTLFMDLVGPESGYIRRELRCEPPRGKQDRSNLVPLKLG